LFQALADPNPRVAARAARAIGKIGDPRAYHALLTALQHPSPDVRYEACRALVDIQVADAITVLHEHAEHDPGTTSWGAPVSAAARRAADELAASAMPPTPDADFDRASRLVRDQQGQQ
jgi:HEAT repeat protein